MHIHKSSKSIVNKIKIWFILLEFDMTSILTSKKLKIIIFIWKYFNHFYLSLTDKQ